MFIIGLTGPSGAGKTTALRVLEEMGGQVYDCDAVYHEMLRSDPELLGRIEAAFPGSVVKGALDRKALGARLFADPAGLQRLTDLTQPLVAKRVLEEIAKSEASASGGRPMAAPAAAASPACHSERSEAEPKNPYSPSPAACCPLPAASFCGSSCGEQCSPLQAESSPLPSSVPDSRFPVPFRFAVIDAIGLFESGLGERCDLTVAVIADPETRVKRLTARDGVTEEYARARIAAQKDADWYARRADLTLENNGSEAAFEARCRALFSQRLRAAASRPGGAGRFSERETSNQSEEESL
ncbi:MAG: dephospho-CoA kinase [Oscillospiraceae bacterium]|nr:dephospho-CoA kinase [Oscillospiraceae bacterium]MBR7010672.1 dephospho-CoA kinase [Oscillospiraceae bacterium]